MSVQGIIFSNLHDKNIPELTQKRTMASVPYAGRYRLIDFTLSNMVNSGITDVSVITHYNYQSLMDHIGAGKDWDLARRSG
ncbi:MAG: sugar phosphate nucleotidyltransferase [Candidatus Flemingiibacterium sp.]